MGKFQLITKGLIKENPTFVLLLGMCPTLATTTSAINGMSMGLATMFVLILSNIVISAIAAYIPDKVRIPSYIVVIATFVTLLQFIMQAYVPDVYETLGLFIPLIVVNCIVLGRAEAFANKNSVLIRHSTASASVSDSHARLQCSALCARSSAAARHSVSSSSRVTVSSHSCLLREPSSHWDTLS